ncbi:TRAP transporter substrate-binding protein [Microbacterium soli]|uniref:TRAP transporter substrate-binding protein n=1 Tax=Microbacterium soli TaxID=446075 RepID=A0ABP7NA63_9MICO
MATKKRWLIVAAAAAVLVTMTGCTRGAAPAPAADDGELAERTIIFAHIAPENHPYHAAAEKFKELVEEQSEGAITVELYPGAQLGGERDINESILEGSVHVGIGAGALSSLSPIVNLFELPFLINGQEHLADIIGSDALDPVEDKLGETGFQVLDWLSTGDSAIQTVDRAVTTPEDLQGLKLRVIENPALIDAMQALGASPTPLPLTEVFTSIQTGVVDGTTMDWTSIVSLSLHELFTHSTSPDIPFLAEPRPVIVSADFWEGLNDSERDVISSAMEEAAAAERAEFVAAQEKAVTATRDSGVTFADIDEAAFMAALEPVWQKWADELDAQDVLNRINELR